MWLCFWRRKIKYSNMFLVHDDNIWVLHLFEFCLFCGLDTSIWCCFGYIYLQECWSIFYAPLIFSKVVGIARWCLDEEVFWICLNNIKLIFRCLDKESVMSTSYNSTIFYWLLFCCGLESSISKIVIRYSYRYSIRLTFS